MERSEEFWKERLDADLPEDWERAIKKVYAAYPEDCLPNGLCDPMYILNTLAHELGLGDGRGAFFNFNVEPTHTRCSCGMIIEKDKPCPTGENPFRQ